MPSDTELLVTRTFVVGIFEDLWLSDIADMAELSAVDQRFVSFLGQFDIGYQTYSQMTIEAAVMSGRRSWCSPSVGKRLLRCALTAFWE